MLAGRDAPMDVDQDVDVAPRTDRERARGDHGAADALLRRFDRWVLVGLAVSFLAGAVFDFVVLRPPLASLRELTDQQSHIVSAVAFPLHGFDLYRRPISEFPHPDGQLTTIDGPNRPLHFNWEQFPRPYPPGAWLYAAVEAILFVTTDLEQTTLNRLSNLKFLAASQWLLWLLWRLFRDAGRGLERGWALFAWLGASLGVFYLVWCESTRWALSGIYDSLPVALVFVSAAALRAQRPADAALAYAGAVFMHFRALWFLPLFGVALLEVARARHHLTSRDWVKLGAAACLVGVSATAFAILLPWLHRFPTTNPLWQSDLTFWGMLAFGAGAVTLGLRRQHWLFAVCVAWQLLFATRTPQMMAWHALWLLPFFALGRAPTRAFLLGAFALYFVDAAFIYRAQPVPLRLWRPVIELLRDHGNGGGAAATPRSPHALTA